MEYVFPPAAPATVAVAGETARFPVRRIFCVGRNYAAHAREMGRDPDRAPPFFFTKPADSVVDDGETVAYPPETENFHYEGELIAAIGTGGFDIPVRQALDHVWGYAVGNELTRRDLQLAARTQGRPWDWGKAFDRSSVCGPIHPVAEVGHPASGAIRLTVNGEVKQNADPRTGLFCHGDAPGLADVCLYAQVCNNRRFDVEMTSYPTIVRIFAACDAVEAFRLAAPGAQHDAA